MRALRAAFDGRLGREFVLMASFPVFPPICFLSLFTNIGAPPPPVCRPTLQPSCHRFEGGEDLIMRLVSEIRRSAGFRRTGRQGARYTVVECKGLGAERDGRDGLVQRGPLLYEGG